jgi:putative GTP pyrophosphokinase
MARNIKPEYTRKRVTKAGDNVRLGVEDDEDIKIIENWRAAHNKILNDWQATLRGKCKNYINVVFAQRLKRRSTIFDKLKRQPDMQLARMHDIAGCRLIFDNISDLNEFRLDVHNARMKHERRKAESIPYPYDYIAQPHPDNSGYRGIHDIYQYHARANRPTEWNGLLTEIQYRTIPQHAWATAVEIAGQITGSLTKFGQGDEEQKEFFRLASEIIARAHEFMNSCYPNYSNQELVSQFNKLETKIGLLNRLSQIRTAGTTYDFFKQNYILILSRSNQSSLRVFAFKSLPEATIKYFELEKEYNNDEDIDIVLVRAPSEENLKVSYKNYFSDTQDFVRLINLGLKRLGMPQVMHNHTYAKHLF